MCTSSRTTSGSASRITATACRRPGVADDVDRAVELGAHAGAEQMVVVDEEDPRATRPFTERALLPRCRAPARPRKQELDLGAARRAPW